MWDFYLITSILEANTLSLQAQKTAGGSVLIPLDNAYPVYCIIDIRNTYMAKRVTKKKTIRKSSSGTSVDHGFEMDFVIIVGGGFLLIMIIMMAVAR